MATFNSRLLLPGSCAEPAEHGTPDNFDKAFLPSATAVCVLSKGGNNLYHDADAKKLR